MTSGESAISSAAYLRRRTESPAPKRTSICTLRPSIQPSCCNPCRNASDSALAYASSAEPTSQPIRRTRSDCCARAANGQAAATPPRRVMTSRRRIASPGAQDKASYRLRLAHRKEPTDVRFGSKADMCSAKRHVRFTPKSGHVRCKQECPLWAKSGHPRHLFDHIVGLGEQ